MVAQALPEEIPELERGRTSQINWSLSNMTQALLQSCFWVVKDLSRNENIKLLILALSSIDQLCCHQFLQNCIVLCGCHQLHVALYST